MLSNYCEQVNGIENIQEFSGNGNNLTNKCQKMRNMCILFSVMLLLVLVSTLIVHLKYQEVNQELIAKKEALLQLEQLSSEIDNVCYLLDVSGEEINEKCQSAYIKIVNTVDSDIQDFKNYSNELISLIKEYERISGEDYTYVYEDVDVQANFDVAMEQKEDSIRVIEGYNELYEEAQTMSDPLERAKKKAEADLYCFSDETIGLLFHTEFSSTVFSDTDDIISNERTHHKINQMTSKLGSLKVGLIVFVVIDCIMLSITILLIIKAKKFKHT